MAIDGFWPIISTNLTIISISATLYKNQLSFKSFATLTTCALSKLKHS